MNRAVLVIVASALVLAVGCKPKAGSGCKIDTKEQCIDDKQALACHDSKWEAMTCDGPAGCKKSGNEHVCDQSVAREKETCNLLGDVICTSDKKGLLECQKYRWAAVQGCLGARGCAAEGKRVTCDDSIASAGGACKDEDDFACSTDAKAALVCRSQTFVVANACKGPKGCRVTGDKAAGFKIECDDSLAVLGDPCNKDGHYACAADERSILKCVGQKFAQDEKCPKKEKCSVRGELVGCF